MAATVRVWAPPDLATQHHAVPPPDDTSHEWEGTTACGLTQALRWVPGETVDRARTCQACVAVAGTAPPLEGDHPGPV
jgi:hypothetical protein